MRTTVLAAALSLAACAHEADLFLGVPEDRAILLEDEDPQTPLRGVPKVTAVQLSDEATYGALRRRGRIAAEERRGEWLYFATREELHAPIPGAPADGAVAIVTRRFKARVGGVE